MGYVYGDFLTIKTTNEKYIGVFVSGDNNYDYFLAFTDFYGDHVPEPSYFATCSLWVNQFGNENSFVAFDVVTINKDLLDSALEVNLIWHIDMQGMVGQIGLHPMEDIFTLTDYFTDLLRKLTTTSEAYDPLLSFQQKSLMPIDKLLKLLTPVNPFTTVKLYHAKDESIQYWQIYGTSEPIGLVVCHGEVGAVGEYQEIKGKSLEETKQIYQMLIDEKKKEAYYEYELISKLILQFKTSDSWGDGDDLKFRNEIWDYLDKYLFWTGNGAITGGDIGSGSVNLFFHAVSYPLAVNTINTALLEKQINRPYIIAIEDEDSLEGLSSGQVRILYPDNYEGSPFF
ncbi:hypothetical protein ACX0G9_24040 [Flavitalea flava]